MMKIVTKGGWVAGVMAALLLGAIVAPAQAGTITQRWDESSKVIADMSTKQDKFELWAASRRVTALDHHHWTVEHEEPEFPSFGKTRSEWNFHADKGVGRHVWMFDMHGPGKFHDGHFPWWLDGDKPGNYHEHIPCHDVAPVPLPAAGWLLFSGVAGLAALRRQYKRP